MPGRSTHAEVLFVLFVILLCLLAHQPVPNFVKFNNNNGTGALASSVYDPGPSYGEVGLLVMEPQNGLIEGRRSGSYTESDAITFENVVLHNGDLHLFALDTDGRNFVNNGLEGHLMQYRAFIGRKIETKHIAQPKIILHAHKLDVARACPTSRMELESAFFFSPWHIDNMVHLHNDNILPLLRTQFHACSSTNTTKHNGNANSPDKNSTTDAPTAITRHGRACGGLPTTLYALPGDSSRDMKRVQAALALQVLFDGVHQAEEALSVGVTRCLRRLTWGRGPKYMYIDLPDAELAAVAGALRRALFAWYGLPEDGGGGPAGGVPVGTGGRPVPRPVRGPAPPASHRCAPPAADAAPSQVGVPAVAPLPDQPAAMLPLPQEARPEASAGSSVAGEAPLPPPDETALGQHQNALPSVNLTANAAPSQPGIAAVAPLPAQPAAGLPLPQEARPEASARSSVVGDAHLSLLAETASGQRQIPFVSVNLTVDAAAAVPSVPAQPAAAGLPLPQVAGSEARAGLSVGDAPLPLLNETASGQHQNALPGANLSLPFPSGEGAATMHVAGSGEGIGASVLESPRVPPQVENGAQQGTLRRRLAMANNTSPAAPSAAVVEPSAATQLALCNSAANVSHWEWPAEPGHWEAPLKAIYLHRDVSDTRGVKNHWVFEAICRQLGLQCDITPFDYSVTHAHFNATLRRLAQADIIFGPHGAGLAHVLYAKPGAQLVQFFDTPTRQEAWEPKFGKLAAAIGGGQVAILMPNTPVARRPYGQSPLRAFDLRVCRNVAAAKEALATAMRALRPLGDVFAFADPTAEVACTEERPPLLPEEPPRRPAWAPWPRPEGGEPEGRGAVAEAGLGAWKDGDSLLLRWVQEAGAGAAQAEQPGHAPDTAPLQGMQTKFDGGVTGQGARSGRAQQASRAGPGAAQQEEVGVSSTVRILLRQRGSGHPPERSADPSVLHRGAEPRMSSSGSFARGLQGEWPRDGEPRWRRRLRVYARVGWGVLAILLGIRLLSFLNRRCGSKGNLEQLTPAHLEGHQIETDSMVQRNISSHLVVSHRKFHHHRQGQEAEPRVAFKNVIAKAGKSTKTS